MTPIETNDLARIHLWVTGHVQGVGFRAFVQQQGSILGVKGWVRNVGANRVESIAEGSRTTLERFADIVSRGPRGSRIDETAFDWEIPTSEFRDFSIRHSV